MGRVIKSQVVAVRCELATPRRGKSACTAQAPITEMSVDSVWEDHLEDLERLVGAGWGFVLAGRLRAYCPTHADRVWDCTCRTHPTRAHLCTSHGETSELVWTATVLPDAVKRELERIGQAA